MGHLPRPTASRQNYHDVELYDVHLRSAQSAHTLYNAFCAHKPCEVDGLEAERLINPIIAMICTKHSNISN